ncbi:hypothetical protein Tco_1223214, partial [Tanacetum coccineum]
NRDMSELALGKDRRERSHQKRLSRPAAQVSRNGKHGNSQSASWPFLASLSKITSVYALGHASDNRIDRSQFPVLFRCISLYISIHKEGRGGGKEGALALSGQFIPLASPGENEYIAPGARSSPPFGDLVA